MPAQSHVPPAVTSASKVTHLECDLLTPRSPPWLPESVLVLPSQHQTQPHVTAHAGDFLLRRLLHGWVSDAPQMHGWDACAAVNNTAVCL